MSTALKGRTHGRTDQRCKREKSSCQPGAVHTWPLADIVRTRLNVCFRFDRPVSDGYFWYLVFGSHKLRHSSDLAEVASCVSAKSRENCNWGRKVWRAQRAILARQLPLLSKL